MKAFILFIVLILLGGCCIAKRVVLEKGDTLTVIRDKPLVVYID